MNSVILLLVIVVVVVIVLAILKAKAQGGAGDEAWPFYAKKPLSQPEQVLYFRLIQASPSARVKMQHVLIIHEVADYPAWKKIFDQAADIRREAGERSYQVLKYENDPTRSSTSRRGHPLQTLALSSSRPNWLRSERNLVFMHDT